MIESPFKILFKFPCRGRKEDFFEGLDSIVNNVADKNNFHISCTLDTDDEILNQPDVIERVTAYPNTSIAWGLSTSKIHAVNRDLPDYGSIIVVMSSDMRFSLYGFDELIRVHTNAVFPDFDGMIGYLDVDTKGVLNTMYIATRRFYSRFNWIYNPEFLSLWADNHILEIILSVTSMSWASFRVVLPEFCVASPADEI
jgi:hypothetical protein